MRLVTLKLFGLEVAGIKAEKGVVTISTLNEALDKTYPLDMLSLIQAQSIPEITDWYNNGGKAKLDTLDAVPYDKCVYGPLYRNPKRIFGIGLNYSDHAGDIGTPPPVGFPGSFFKMADTLIGPEDTILLPKLKEAEKTTAEAELGIILGKDCRDVAEADWQSVIAGYTTILDMTEESILKGNDFLKGNPRYLTIVKNFPSGLNSSLPTKCPMC